MIIDLTTIKDAQTSFDVSIDPAQINLESETANVVNVARVRGKIKKGIVQTDVAGEIHTVVEIECSRCLQPTERSLDTPFSAAFVTAENYTQEKEAEINLDNLEVSIYGGDKIDLTELVREQILLNLPEQIFCRDDCRGFCQKCGANRNLIDCNCEEKEIDPRWSALKNLK
jgi:uncharacterized protein